MGTPNENAQTLINYWKASLANKAKVSANRLAFDMLASGMYSSLRDAREAMDELTSQARVNPFIRTQTFAAQHIFSTALLTEAAGLTDAILAHADYTISKGIIGGTTPPRLIMLDKIFSAGDGGFFAATDPSGLTSWLGSEDVSLAAVSSTIATDPNPDVRAAALQIIGALALPARWSQRPRPTETNAEPPPTQLSAAIASLQAYLPASPWSPDTRSSLNQLAQQAQGRLGMLEALVATVDFSTLPLVPTGDGKQVPTTPPAPKPWYRNGQVLGAGMVALVGGAALAHKRVVG